MSICTKTAETVRVLSRLGNAEPGLDAVGESFLKKLSTADFRVLRFVDLALQSLDVVRVHACWLRLPPFHYGTGASVPSRCPTFAPPAAPRPHFPLAVIENEQTKKLLWKALIGRIYIRFPLFHFSDHALPLGGGTSATAYGTPFYKFLLKFFVHPLLLGVELHCLSAQCDTLPHFSRATWKSKGGK